ncbi:hypothetical protein BO86DRAFT_68119 [Aspergillus japonicus CBS 114.51]|uniref:Uncharacterized protein n=1 Tax=Aspergillus japonicus CBS 114.51 TaxID=1448312 RepID=A0A8T8X3S9_ASPJA|nr:hypothetical protein BO86DRAFT_68119 [Aspergillus japonicus CBS 114.51]RAH82773.1 hypothetical protein BO86DRAFT_68119 [Aspergillus japonicus CBS 114.51]
MRWTMDRMHPSCSLTSLVLEIPHTDSLSLALLFSSEGSGVVSAATAPLCFFSLCLRAASGLNKHSSQNLHNHFVSCVFFYLIYFQTPQFSSHFTLTSPVS